jgi:hypothetical protein
MVIRMITDKDFKEFDDLDFEADQMWSHMLKLTGYATKVKSKFTYHGIILEHLTQAMQYSLKELQSHIRSRVEKLHEISKAQQEIVNRETKQTSD